MNRERLARRGRLSEQTQRVVQRGPSAGVMLLGLVGLVGAIYGGLRLYEWDVRRRVAGAFDDASSRRERARQTGAAEEAKTGALVVRWRVADESVLDPHHDAPANGKRRLALEVEVANREAPLVYVNRTAFALLCDGARRYEPCEQHAVLDMHRWRGSPLADGERARSHVAFDVAVDVTDLELRLEGMDAQGTSVAYEKMDWNVLTTPGEDA